MKRDKDVLGLYPGLTQEQIAERFQVTRQRVQQILAKHGQQGQEALGLVEADNKQISLRLPKALIDSAEASREEITRRLKLARTLTRSEVIRLWVLIGQAAINGADEGD